MNQEVIEAEARPLAIREEVEPQQNLALFGTSDPVDVITKASRVADALKAVVVAKKLVSNIQGKEYPQVEAWQTLAVMLGLSAICEWTRKLDDGWEARFVVQRNGVTIAAAEAQCTRSEKMWRNRDDYALRSMAQTRATSKALRSVLGFVMVLAGYQATPAEEMPRDEKPPREEKPQLSPQAAADRGRKSLKALCRDKGIPDCDYREAMVSLFGPAIWKERGFDGPTSKALDADELRKLYSHLKNRGTR